jgi:predicted RNA binding protein YcfA (HicA-like mRNA interferase family)
MPSPQRFAVVRSLLERHGWWLDRVKGSHHTFKHTSGIIFVVPVHRGKVKPIYVSQAKKLCGEE